ncbi:hypothetical protein BRADI_1g07253v3 [Brachypodium distachyon]|uniref:Uncharacterized protein n=1 Tax=Brachypodium distachyon TaxID=15368 RepID=A0A2K2DIG0_BRADI|nr:hypothetical protein BRADI_1g07253v3 [Brachypodium distachyon]
MCSSAPNCSTRGGRRLNLGSPILPPLPKQWGAHDH